MDSDENKQGAPGSSSEEQSTPVEPKKTETKPADSSPEETATGETPPDTDGPETPDEASEATTAPDPTEAASDDDSRAGEYHDDEDPYAYHPDESTDEQSVLEEESKPASPSTESSATTPPPPPSDEEDDEEDTDDDGMVRMSFMGHLEELRSRIIKALMGVAVAFFVSIIFANDLWRIVSEPAVEALVKLGYENTKLAHIKPMETFTTVWVKLPILTAIFLSSPWILYQVWGFIAPGLYKRERRWAVPFVLCSAGLFITGGLFAYFVAFRFGLAFLLGIGRDINIAPVVSITEYFDLFVNVTLGISVVFELPVLIFFLILLRIVTPRFLISNSRYAVLIIVVIAAIITPTPDVVNLMLFSVPMCLLYFVGVFAGYLLNLHRDNKRFPWWIVGVIVLVMAAVVGGAIYLAVTKYGYHLQDSWPYLAP